MIHSSRRDRKAKAIAEVLAMIANAQAPLAPHRPRPVLEADERPPVPAIVPCFCSTSSAIFRLMILGVILLATYQTTRLLKTNARLITLEFLERGY
jgi:hypothetical protein